MPYNVRMSEVRSREHVWADHWQRARESPERAALRDVPGEPNTGGGEPIPKGHRRTTEERDEAQPRRGDGTFGYKADAGEERKYADHGQHKTKPLSMTHKDWNDAKAQAEEGIRKGDVYERGGRQYVAIADLSYKQIMSGYTACRGPEGKLLIDEYFADDGKARKRSLERGLPSQVFSRTERRKESLSIGQLNRIIESRGGIDDVAKAWVDEAVRAYVEESALSEKAFGKGASSPQERRRAKLEYKARFGGEGRWRETMRTIEAGERILNGYGLSLRNVRTLPGGGFMINGVNRRTASFSEAAPNRIRRKDALAPKNAPKYAKAKEKAKVAEGGAGNALDDLSFDF